ncbi:universal stress protein [Azospirillum soli]|uniref:universal stress protein n=1 Tax=Azospirillum soli TaxID=1304799 RepID=UPI001AEB1E9D|nr:universal stress protein [Azospirillum soli]MBP2314920.1 nucleotide-binding universal stress UspA family protein [Azospirillum soli]
MKKVLVPLTGRPLDRRAVTSAFLVAQRFGAQVEGLSVMPQVEIRTSIESAAIPAALMEQLVRIGQADQAQVVEGARHLFDEIAGRFAGLTASWRQATGPLAETFSEEARLADLAVIAQASDGTNAMGPAIEAALFGSGRPVLLAPLAESTSVGGAVAVAWDGGSAAARAVGAALPVLRRAEKVAILSADSPDEGRAANPERLSEYLAMHGITSTVWKIPASGHAIAKALLGAAKDGGCDLLVMGAYGHSRVREMVWGGVTLNVLREPPPLPILMAH